MSEGVIIVCGPDMEEVRRESMGIKWCFHCRSRNEFHWVKMWPVWDKENDPDGWLPWYGGSYFTECSGCRAHGSNLFPGWSWEASDA